MTYQIVETQYMGKIYQSVIVDLGNNSFETFPVDENNPRYQQWLAEGNTPEPWNPEA